MGVSLPVLILVSDWAPNTIARKPQHDKASRLSCGAGLGAAGLGAARLGTAGLGAWDLNRVARIAIVAKVVTKVSAQPEFSP